MGVSFAGSLSPQAQLLVGWVVVSVETVVARQVLRHYHLDPPGAVVQLTLVHDRRGGWLAELRQVC